MERIGILVAMWGMGSTDPTTPYNQGVARYVRWLQIAYNCIKAEDPTATVVMGGLSSYLMEPFMDRLTVEGAYNFIDEVAFHPYADDPAKVVGRLNKFKNKMRGMAFAKKQPAYMVNRNWFSHRHQFERACWCGR